MKRRSSTAVLFAIPAMLTISGCLDVDVRTTVSSDGSSERVVSMKLDSRNVPASAFPITTDSTWRVEWRETGDTTGKYEYIARKRFNTPDELHREYSTRPDTGIIGLRVSLQKRFEWFYTYFDYNEVYTRHNMFTSVPVSDYLTNDEISRYLHGEESDSLKTKMKAWEERNLFEEFFRPLVDEARRRNDPGLPASLLLAKRDELFVKVTESENRVKGEAKKKPASSRDDESIDQALRVFADVLHTPAVYSLKPAADRAWTAITEKMERDKHPDTWTCSLQMPGLLLSTNSDKVDGSVTTWKFSADQIRVGDYVMLASSRTTNVWAFIITGVAALLVLTMASRSLFRRAAAPAASGTR